MLSPIALPSSSLCCSFQLVWTPTHYLQEVHVGHLPTDITHSLSPPQHYPLLLFQAQTWADTPWWTKGHTFCKISSPHLGWEHMLNHRSHKAENWKANRNQGTKHPWNKDKLINHYLDPQIPLTQILGHQHKNTVNNSQNNNSLPDSSYLTPASPECSNTAEAQLS